MTDNARKKITERIKKLLALSESPNQHEAEAALQKANALIIEHQIEMSEVLINELHAVTTADKGKYIKVSETYRSFIWWLGSVAGKLFDTKTVLRRQSEFAYIGLPEDITLSEALFDYLFTSWLSIVKHDTKIWKEQFHYAPRQYEVKKFKIAHGQGFTEALSYRVNELVRARKAAVEASTGSTALVVLKDQLTQAYLDKLPASRSRFKEQYNEGHLQGYERGDAIPLSGSIDTDANTDPHSIGGS